MIKKARPPIEYSWTDQRTVVKLVSNALANEPRKPGAKILELQRTAENKLANLPRQSIISALETICQAGKDLFVVLPSNYTKMIVFRKPVDFFDVGESRLRTVTEHTAIRLFLLSKFDDWREAQLRKKNVSIQDLAPANP